MKSQKAAGLALLVWFFFVLIYDLSLLGILVATVGRLHADLFPFLLLLNPTDIFRLINLLTFETNGTGLLGIASEQSFSTGGLLIAMLAWIIVPITMAYYRLSKRPI